ncbi:hypothetical protein BC777_1753 [Yoonia maricola]|uniref:Uncharacterized protein n=1 Tax=Yoonia maricola TaxID=420999 RepID=A0A2M8WPM8_9RHOB|nr:hypothetical protein BC777_1753 [Yoonia maricola]
MSRESSPARAEFVICAQIIILAVIQSSALLESVKCAPCGSFLFQLKQGQLR